MVKTNGPCQGGDDCDRPNRRPRRVRLSKKLSRKLRELARGNGVTARLLAEAAVASALQLSPQALLDMLGYHFQTKAGVASHDSWPGKKPPTRAERSDVIDPSVY